MPLLQWNEDDFIGFLEVEPSVEQDQLRHDFEVRTSDIVFHLTVWQYESVCKFSLALEGSAQSLIDLAVFVREAAVWRREGSSEWLELRDCILAGSRFSYIDMGDVFDRRRYPYSHHVRIWVRPQVQVEIVRA